MKRTYRLDRKSDMNRFIRDLGEDLKKELCAEIMERTHQIECPACGTKISIPAGKSHCQHCSEEIDLHLDIDL